MNGIKIFIFSLFLINYIICEEYNNEYNNMIIVNIENNVKHDEMVEYIFFQMDFNNNYYLEYKELYLLQKLTDPHIELTYNIYYNICKYIYADYKYGLDLYKFNQSYTIYSEILGTNLIKDYNIIKNKNYY